MTRDEAVSLLLSRCQRKPTDSRLVANVITELNAAQRALENDPFKPWFLLTGVDIPLDATGYMATLPTDYITVDDNDNAVMLKDTTVTPNQLHKLEKADYAEVARGLKPIEAPAFWADNGTTLLLSRYFLLMSVRLIYKARQAINTSAFGAGGQPGPNYWYQYAGEYLICAAGAKFASFYLSDDTKAKMFDAGKTEERGRLIMEDTAREEAARSRFMGSDEWESGTGLGANGALPAPPLVLT